MGKSDQENPKGKSTVKVKDLSPKDDTRVKGGVSSGGDRPMESLSLRSGDAYLKIEGIDGE
jgi:hypothetical protein